MLTVEMLEQALVALRQLAVTPRFEWIGEGGGACEFGGRKWLFLDLAQSPAEQLNLALDCLRNQPGVGDLRLSAGLTRLVGRRTAA